MEMGEERNLVTVFFKKYLTLSTNSSIGGSPRHLCIDIWLLRGYYLQNKPNYALPLFYLHN